MLIKALKDLVYFFGDVLVAVVVVACLRFPMLNTQQPKDSQVLLSFAIICDSYWKTIDRNKSLPVIKFLKRHRARLPCNFKISDLLF